MPEAVAIALAVASFVLGILNWRREHVRRREEVTARRRAAVSARYERRDKTVWLLLHNGGPSEARAVDLQPLLAVGQGDHLPEPAGSSALPVDLQPGQELSIPVVIVLDTAPMIRARLTWTDDSGAQERQLTLDVP